MFRLRCLSQNLLRSLSSRYSDLPIDALSLQANYRACVDFASNVLTSSTLQPYSSTGDSTCVEAQNSTAYWNDPCCNPYTTYASCCLPRNLNQQLPVSAANAGNPR